MVDQVLDGQSVDLCSVGCELKALNNNMHISMVVDPQTVLDFCFMGYELKALDMQHNNNTGGNRTGDIA